MTTLAVIERRWLHSFEEDADGVVVYRPEEFGFPSARRPRAMLELKADGSFVQLLPSRGDGRQSHAGQWSATDDGRLILAYAAPARSASSFALVQADRELLRLRGAP
jgi:hypothetical protein